MAFFLRARALSIGAKLDALQTERQRSGKPSPQGVAHRPKFYDFSQNFAGLLGPKLRESGPETPTGFFAPFFYAQRLAENPGDVF